MSVAVVSTPNKPRRAPWRRSVLAVLAGLVANVLLATLTDLLLVAAGVFPPLADFGRPESFNDSLLALALVYRTVYGVFGCWLTARLAPRSPMAHSLVLGGIGFIVGVIGAVATWGAWTSWYSLAIIATTLPAAWLGARFAQRTQK
jgi:hypothetical protein